MDINYFARLNYRDMSDKFGIKVDDRRRHVYVIGKTGMGKTAMLQNMAVQDVLAGRGVGIIDPHGEFAERVLDFIPRERKDDVVYFNPADFEFPIGLNLLENVGFDRRHLVASGLMGVFKKIWVDVWSARMEYILNNAILALLEYPKATLLDVNRMLANKDFRRRVIEHVQDPIVKAFWIEEFGKYTDRLASEASAAIQNKVGQFTAAPLIRNIIGQHKSTIDLRKIMDEKKIFIVNLSKGRIGEDNARLLGAMIITKIYLAAMSRINVPEEERVDFFLYVDEFQNFASEAFADILSESRKYRLSLILAHQYIAQMDDAVRDAVFGNIGTLISFRIGADDAEFIEKEFVPTFVTEDLVSLTKYNILLKLMIDGATSRAFSAVTLTPYVPEEESSREEIIKSSRSKYGTPREDIEKVIQEWSASVVDSKNSGKSGEMFEMREAPTLYDAVCAECGKETKIPFEPDGKRPVYCKKCRTKHQKERHNNTQNNPSSGDKAPPYKRSQDEKQNVSAGETNPPSKSKNEVDLKGLRKLLEDV